MFERRHYIEIAKAMRGRQPIVDPADRYDIGRSVQWEEMIAHLVEVFQADNPNFKTTTFKSACGLDIDVAEHIADFNREHDHAAKQREAHGEAIAQREAANTPWPNMREETPHHARNGYGDAYYGNIVGGTD